MPQKNKDYIKLFRGLLKWEWFTDIKVAHLWVYILLKANWTDGSYKGQEVKRGSFITSYETMMCETGLSKQEIRTALGKLEMTGEITRVATHHQQTITVVNYAIMQGEKENSNTQTTSQQQSSNTSSTPNEEYKEGKNNKNNKNKELTTNNNSYICHPDVTEVKAYILEKGYHFSAEEFVAFYESNGWKVGKNPMKSWKAACVTWESNWKKKHQLEGKSWLEVAADLERKIGDETTKE